MSKTHRHTDKYNPKPEYRRAGRPRGNRSISVRSIRRDEPDLAKLSRAVIALALAEAEREASERTDAHSNENPSEPTND